MLRSFAVAGAGTSHEIIQRRWTIFAVLALLGTTATAAEWGPGLPLAPSVRASSELPPSRNGEIDYRADNTLDGRRSTAWSEGAPGPGIGAFLTYDFPRRLRVNRIDIVNGYAKSATAFAENARIRKARLATEAGTFELSLSDDDTLQVFEGDFGPTSTATLEVLEVYPGSRWQDLLVTEVTFWGGPADSAAPTERPAAASPLRRRALPPAAIAAQLEVFVGAGPGEACWEEAATSPPRVVAEPGLRTEAGLLTSLCFLGFDLARDLDVEVTAPDGTVERARVRAVLDGQLLHWVWAARPGSPRGSYTVVARQGDRVASVTIEVEGAAKPRLRVAPIDRESPFDLPPRADPGGRFNLYLAGFPPDTEVFVHLYGARQAGPASYLNSLSVPVDGNGEAIYALETRTTDPEGVYCLGLDPPFVVGYGRRRHPDFAGSPDDAQALCFDTMFGLGRASFGG